MKKVNINIFKPPGTVVYTGKSEVQTSVRHFVYSKTDPVAQLEG